MKAVVVESYDAIENIALKEVPAPEPAAGQVRVRIQAASVGFVDGLKIRGLYQTKDPLPFTPGTEFTGLVDGLGPGVREPLLGTAVVGMARSGALAEYIAVPAGSVIPMPAAVSPEVGASFPANYLTGLYALQERAALQAGESLLVLGAAGGVGIAAVQIGKLLGARVIAAASSEEKRQFAARFGADDTVDYTREGWRDEVKRLTGGKGADVIYDPVGGDIGLLAFRAIAWRGRHLVVGFAGGGIPALPFNLPLLKGGALVGVDMAQIGQREPEVQARVMSQLLAWIAKKALVPVVGQVFAFEDFREAFKSMTSRAALGKMVVRIG